ncbi:type 1 glutamine amidotransferase domain-containing protein [Kitasatospora atroaurantiaca]|uniref:ThiJ/PfpI family protein n=1 Tax=Kitasatospora atroaurantiaca TaxID=285545 RepID=A0A561F1I1_9ACTN|nr:type 1 glutamine amidotransferase domain-containing protein [Kitasatospora atroaurantiaca]TWE21718.1 ThiJ/PfpI family protein [Kitasatospora atroaurantiaca]
MATVLMPIPAQDFDPSEVAVGWQVLTLAGHRVVFATPEGERATGDELMLTGQGLDPWGRVPGLRRVLGVGRILRANADARAAYTQMLRSEEFRNPVPWDKASLADSDGLYLPGGHRARGMRRYLESMTLQALVVEAFRRGMPVAAICHGVLLAARSTDPDTGRSVLHGRRTTALTWRQENQAWQLARRTRFWDPDYYRTYLEEPGRPKGYMSVQQEVTRNLARPEDFLEVEPGSPDAFRKTSGLRDTATDDRPAFVVEDGNYLSGRWPGDVHALARRFAERLA